MAKHIWKKGRECRLKGNNEEIQGSLGLNRYVHQDEISLWLLVQTQLEFPELEANHCATALLKQQLKPYSTATKLGYVLPFGFTSFPGRWYHIPHPLSSSALETLQLAVCQEDCPTPSLGPSSLQERASSAKPSSDLPGSLQPSLRLRRHPASPDLHPQGTLTHKSHTSLPWSPASAGYTCNSAGWTTGTRVAGSHLLCQLSRRHNPQSDICFLGGGERNPSSLPLSSPKIAVVESAPTAYNFHTQLEQ